MVRLTGLWKKVSQKDGRVYMEGPFKMEQIRQAMDELGADPDTFEGKMFVFEVTKTGPNSPDYVVYVADKPKSPID